MKGSNMLEGQSLASQVEGIKEDQGNLAVLRSTILDLSASAGCVLSEDQIALLDEAIKAHKLISVLSIDAEEREKSKKQVYPDAAVTAIAYVTIDDYYCPALLERATVEKNLENELFILENGHRTVVTEFVRTSDIFRGEFDELLKALIKSKTVIDPAEFKEIHSVTGGRWKYTLYTIDGVLYNFTTQTV